MTSSPTASAEEVYRRLLTLSGLRGDKVRRYRVRLRLHTELTALYRFPPQPCLAPFGPFTDAETTQALRDKHIREPSLRCEYLTHLDYLRRYRHPDRLALMEGPMVTGLSP